MLPLTVRAAAKLNLFLHVLAKQADGYHTIESLVVFTELADTLTIAPAEELTLAVHGEFAADAGMHDSNLVLKAARALQTTYGVQRGARLTLTKNIPVGAGLGGGSADAAAALRGLARFWQLHISKHDVRWLASRLGADVPMCLDSVPTLAQGIGEKLTPLLPPLPPLFVLLVHPCRVLLTRDVYAALTLAPACSTWQGDFSTASAFLASLAPTRNHLQTAAIAVDAAVAELLLALETLQPAADFIRMTGSGACCFALYRDANEAARAAQHLAHHHPEWWIKTTRIAQAD